MLTREEKEAVRVAIGKVPCLGCLLYNHTPQGCGGCLDWTMPFHCPACGFEAELQDFTGEGDIECPECHYHPTWAEYDLQGEKAFWQAKREAVISVLELGAPVGDTGW